MRLMRLMSLMGLGMARRIQWVPVSFHSGPLEADIALASRSWGLPVDKYGGWRRAGHGLTEPDRPARRPGRVKAQRPPGDQQHHRRAQQKAPHFLALAQ